MAALPSHEADHVVLLHANGPFEEQVPLHGVELAGFFVVPGGRPNNLPTAHQVAAGTARNCKMWGRALKLLQHLDVGRVGQRRLVQKGPKG